MALIVFRVSRSPLQTTQVLSLLLEPPADSISTLPPINPKGGEIYIYHSKAEEKGMSIGGLREDLVSFVFNKVLIGTMELIAAYITIVRIILEPILPLHLLHVTR